MAVTLEKKVRTVTLVKGSDPIPVADLLHGLYQVTIKTLDDLALHFRYNSVRYNRGTLPH